MMFGVKFFDALEYRSRQLLTSLVLVVIHFFLLNSIIAINHCLALIVRLLSIAPFLQQPTILQHSQLLQTVIINDKKSIQWHPLHINQGNKF